MRYNWVKQPIYVSEPEPFVLKIVLSHITKFETKTCLYFKEENRLSIVDNNISFICSIEQAESIIESIHEFTIMPLYLK